MNMDLEAIAWETNKNRTNEGYCGSLYLRRKIQLCFSLCMQNKTKTSNLLDI